jgi:dihydrofolate reductase
MSPDTQEITMDRKITAHLFHTVNDVVEHPERWQFDAFGQEEGQMMAEMTARSSDVVIGRKLWQEWSAFWPGKQDPFADWVNPVRKHVISTTLAENPGWNSTLPPTRWRPSAVSAPRTAETSPWSAVSRRSAHCSSPD